jgi:hypothetical protein
MVDSFPLDDSELNETTLIIPVGTPLGQTLCRHFGQTYVAIMWTNFMSGDRASPSRAGTDPLERAASVIQVVASLPEFHLC